MLEPVTASLRQLHLSDPHPWMVGFSGGKGSSLVAHLIFEAVRSIPADDRTKEIHVLCRRPPGSARCPDYGFNAGSNFR